MTLLESFVLGIIQGLTEFFPISSSAHLVLTEKVFGLHPSQFIFFDLTLHLGTLMAVVVFFRSSIVDLIGAFKKNKNESLAKRKLTYLLILATLVTAFIGIQAKGMIEKIFDNISMIAFFLIFNGIILFLTRMKKSFKTENLTDIMLWQALIIGASQVLGLMPGISRSGITIATGIFIGLRAKNAAQFSFLLAILAIAGAFIMEVGFCIGQIDLSMMMQYITGFLASFVVGVFAIKILFDIIKRERFFLFGGYCIFLGMVLLIIKFL